MSIILFEFEDGLLGAWILTLSLSLSKYWLLLLKVIFKLEFQSCLILLLSFVLGYARASWIKRRYWWHWTKGTCAQCSEFTKLTPVSIVSPSAKHDFCSTLLLQSANAHKNSLRRFTQCFTFLSPQPVKYFCFETRFSVLVLVRMSFYNVSQSRIIIFRPLTLVLLWMTNPASGSAVA